MIARRHPVVLARDLALSLVLGLVVACGAGRAEIVKTAQGTTETALGALDALGRSFATWDEQHQQDIVDAAPSREDGAAKLAAYRAKRQKVTAALSAAYASIGAVAAVLPLAQIDEKHFDVVTLIGLVTKAVAAVKDAQAALLSALGDSS